MFKIERFRQPKFLLAAMTLLQALWLAVMWGLGYVPHMEKIPFLLAFTLIAGLTISYLPAQILSRIRQFKEHLIENQRLFILTFCALFLTIGGIYIYYMAWGPDEKGVFDANKIVAEQGVAQFFATYATIPWLGKQHPPLLPLVQGIFMHVFGVDLFRVRLVALFTGLGTMILTYFIGRTLYDRQTGFLAAWLLLSLRFSLHFSTTINNDISVTFFFTLAVFFIIRLLNNPRYNFSVTAGIAVGAGLLSKYTMSLIYPMLLGLLFFNTPLTQSKSRLDKRPLKDRFLWRNSRPNTAETALTGEGQFYTTALIRFKHLLIVTLLSIGILAIWLLYLNQLDLLAAHGDTIAFHAGFELSEMGSLSLMNEWRINYRLRALLAIPSALGIYNIPLLLLGGIYLVRRQSQSDLFVLLWIAVVFVPLILTLPVSRYFMPAFPALALMMAHGVRYIPSATEQAIMLGLLYSVSILHLYMF